MDRDLEACKSRRPLTRAAGAFEVVHRPVGQHAVLMVRGDLDGMNAPELGRAVRRALATKPQQLVIDLCKVAFVSYRGLSVLLTARQCALRLEVDLSLACDVPSTLGLLDDMRLDRDFDIHPTWVDALPRPGDTRA